MSHALQKSLATFIENMVGVDTPACYNSSDEFKAWMELEDDAHTQPRGFFCRDCSPHYRLEMLKKKRCFQTDPVVKKLFE